MTTLAALLRGNPNYRYTWMAQVVSEIGDYFNNIAVFALVMEKSGSGLVVSGVMLSRAIPAMLAGPAAGVLLDRLDRKRIMIASDLVRAAVALAFVLTIHQPRPWLLYLLSAVLIGFMLGRLRLIPAWAAWAFALTSPLTIPITLVHTLLFQDVLKYLVCVLWIVGAIPAALAMLTNKDLVQPSPSQAQSIKE